MEAMEYYQEVMIAVMTVMGETSIEHRCGVLLLNWSMNSLPNRWCRRPSETHGHLYKATTYL
jgi:hypothetical protein